MASPTWKRVGLAAAAAVALLLLLAGGGLWLLSSGTRFAVRPGDPAPSVTFTGTDGTAVRLEDLRGRIVLLDFWSST